MDPTQAPQQQPNVDPAQLQQIMAQRGASTPQAAPPPQAAGGALPPSSPVQGGDTSTDAITSAILNATQALDQSRAHMTSIAQHIQDVQAAPVGWHPQMKPITGQGFGGNVKNLLGDIGKGALLAGAATRPGQAIMDVEQAPARARRAQELGGLKEQLEAEKAGLSATGQEVTGLGMAGRLGIGQQGADARTASAGAQKERADAYAANIGNNIKVSAQRLALGYSNLDEKTRHNHAAELVSQVRNELASQRNEIDKYGIDTNALSRQAIANAMIGIKQEDAHSMLADIDSWFGTNLTPQAPAVAAGGQPVGQTVPPTQPMAQGKPSAPTKPAQGAKKQAYKVGNVWYDATTHQPITGK